MSTARVTITYSDPDWTAESWVQDGVDSEAALKRRRDFTRVGPGWAEMDHPEEHTAAGPLPPRCERLDWLERSP